MNDTFLLCRPCGILHPLSPREDDGAAEDLMHFRARHQMHGLEEARLVPDSALFDGRSWDPMSTCWFRVAVGSDLLAVRSSRRSIEDPRHHQVTSAFPASDEQVEIEASLVRAALDRDFYPHALRPAKMERFLRTLEELVNELDPVSVPTVFDDVDVPNASIGPLPIAARAALLARCATIFDAWELERVCRFIAAHSDEDGALAVRVRRVRNRSAA